MYVNMSELDSNELILPDFDRNFGRIKYVNTARDHSSGLRTYILQPEVGDKPYH